MENLQILLEFGDFLIPIYSESFETLVIQFGP
jgi:hypothetical protein